VNSSRIRLSTLLVRCANMSDQYDVNEFTLSATKLA